MFLLTIRYWLVSAPFSSDWPHLKIDWSASRTTEDLTEVALATLGRYGYDGRGNLRGDLSPTHTQVMHYLLDQCLNNLLLCIGYEMRNDCEF